MRYRFVLADVFTERPFGGNQLAVFPDARGLPEEAMQALAREFNFSEITFVLPPGDPAHAGRVRIFTPATELPFAGHPTVGTAVVLAAERGGGDGRLLLAEGIGVVPVDVAGSYARLEVTAPYQTPEHRPSATAVAEVLSLAEEDVVETWYGGVGLGFCYVRLTSAAAVDRAALDHAAWAARLAGSWSSDLYVFAGDFADGGELYARAFVPGMGIGEDPATGAACAGLVAGLAHHSAYRAAEYALRIDQGVAMRRPSRIEATARTDHGRLAAALVGGHTAIVGEGTLRVPGAPGTA